MTELSKVQIIKAAKELNNILGLKENDGTPGIKTGGGSTKQQISEKIIEAGAFIDPVSDEFTETTWEVLEQLGAAHKPTGIETTTTEEVPEPVIENIAAPEIEVVEEKEIKEIQEEFLDPVEDPVVPEVKEVIPVVTELENVNQEPLSKYLDTLLTHGQEFNEIVKTMKDLSIARGLKVFQTPGSVRAHIKYRIKGGYTFPVDYLK